MAERNPFKELVKSKTDKEVRQTLVAPIIVGEIYMVAPETQTTIGAAGGATALPATPAGYFKIVLGDTEYAVPFYAAS